MNPKEKLVSDRNIGGHATIAMEHFSHILDSIEQNAHNEIKMRFREGKPSSELLTAKLVAIDEIRAKLKAQIAVGNSAISKMINGEPK